MDELLLELSSEDPVLLKQAFNAGLLVLVKNAGFETEEKESSFSNDVFLQLLEHGLSLASPIGSVTFDRLVIEAMSQYSDIRFYCYRNYGKLLAKSPSSHMVGRIFDILVRTEFPSERELEIGKSLTGVKGLYREASEVRKEFSDCWLGLLRRLPDKKIRRLLVCLEDKILPHLTRPELLAPGLEDIFNQGGLNSVLAMDAIFTLMRSYNLEFPNFYDRLYGMVTYDILHSPYRVNFMKSCQLFVSSTMIPAYIIAGFCKRLARLAVSSSPAVVAWIISFIYNLLWRYPSCRVLLHREQSSREDPFLKDECSLAKCHAIESSLWELKSLEHHYWSRISRLVGLFKEGFQKPPFDVDSIADETDEFHISLAIQEELAHRWSKRPPTRFVISDRLFCD